MNNCKVVGGKIANDNRNQTMTNLVKDAVENSSVEFKNKANLILISEINKNTKRFINFFNKELQDRGIDLVVDSIEDINSKINNSKNAKYNNLTRDILVSYLKHLVADVNNYNTVGIISNYGFTSRSARELGAEYIADLLFREIHANEELPKGQRLTHQKLIDKVRSNIVTEFNIMFKNFKQEMNIKLKEEDEANKKGDIKTNNYSKYRRDIALYEKTVKTISNINKEINNATEIYNKNKTKENRDNLDKLKNRKSKLTTILNARKKYIINIHGNVQQKNFCAIATNINQPSFIDRIWSQSKISDYRNTYEDGFNNDFLESDDVLIYEAESIDETSKTWSDETKANFTNGISRDVKYQLSTIYKMALPFEPSDTNSDFSTNYDRDNLCGVPVAYNYRYVVAQLESNCKFDDIYTFIESVKVLATKNPNNYGFIELYDRMIKNATLAIRLFNQLKKPIVDKTMINNSRSENEKNYINNEQANARTSQYYDMINGIKTTYSSRSEYKAEQDKAISNAQKILDDASSSRSNNTPLGFISGKSNNKSNNLSDAQRKELNEIITNLFTFYFPHLNRITVEKSLQAISNENAYDTYKNIINKFSNVLNRIDVNIKIELTKYDEHIKTLAKWYSDEKAGKKVDAKPQYSIYNFDVTNDNTISNALIYFAELVYKFDKNNVQLNSKNANGNLSSDLQNNCYISRIFDILKSGNMTALRNLKDEIDRCPQYKYNPLFYGLRDDSGKLLVHGLFNTETNDIDMKGVEMINVTLFDGIINETTGEGITYKQLTKNDYFITKLIKYFNPSKHKSDNTNVSSETCESFFNTPSDAPKNYTIRVPRFKFTDKKGIGTVNIDEDVINNLVNKEVQSYIERVYTGKYEEQAKSDIIEIFKNKDKAKLTYLTDAEFSEFIQNRRKVNVRFNETINKDYNETNLYKVLYKKGNKLHILYVQDSMPEYNKNKRNRNFIVNNADILDIVTFDLDNNVVDKNVAIKELVDKVSETDKSIKRRISEQAVLNNEINFNVNKNTEMFMAFRQNVKSEINGFVNGLNALFVRDENGYYRIKSDDIAIDNLLEKYHYLVDKKTRKRLLVKNGKLAGNVFNFSKLFPSNNYDAKAALETNLSLYGEGGLIKSDNRGLHINPENIVGEDSNIFVSIDSDGKFILNDNFDLNQIVDNIVEQWLKSFSVDIVESYQEFNNVVDLVLNYGEKTMPRIIEMILGDVLNNYFTTELFSGEPTFYSDSRDYLKRAKEVQAGGESYAFYKIDEVRNSEIHDLENITEVLDFVDTKGSPVGIQARNGFKALTIRNSVSAISNADLIYKEVYDYNVYHLKNVGTYTKDEIETIAKVRATQIASRFGYGEKGKATKKNDAQSYITLEEFIRRRMADGTINDYKEIIDKIKEIRYEKDVAKKQTLINEFMLKNNAKIQVQKNFYFDMHYDSETGVRYPRQVKNAEFVLIPEFLEGTSLLELYNFMIENGIDQINTEETNKAAKRNILTFWDENGIADVNNFKEQLKANPKAVENYYYQYLYKQQDIVDHMVDEKNKAGVQILRKVKDNATANTKPFVDEFEKNYIANVEESFAELIHSCGWKVDENGNISNIDGSTISFEEFFKKGKQQAAKLGLDSNFAEYFEIDEATKLPKIPVWMNSVSGKIESISQAIFNSVVTRQQLPGWHAAQVTGIGIGKQIADEKGVYHELKYHPKGKKLDNIDTFEKVKELYKDSGGEYVQLANAVFDVCGKVGIKIKSVSGRELGGDLVLGDNHDGYIRIHKNVKKLSKEFGKTVGEIILHEAIHVLTIYAIENKQNLSKAAQDAVTTIEACYEKLISVEDRHNFIVNNDYYGLKNAHEMIAELANPKFRQILKKHNLFDTIIESIKDILSYLFNNKLVNKSDNLEQILEKSLYTLIDNFNEKEYTDFIINKIGLRYGKYNLDNQKISKATLNKIIEAADNDKSYTVNANIKNTTLAKNKKGDIVIYRNEGEILFMRILDISDNSVTIKALDPDKAGIEIFDDYNLTSEFFDYENEPYIEIMVPRWSKLLEGHSIEDIENGKCDIQIIYRMPTEGKQSVAVAKVVGILPDVYGSTVLVPDAWVTQTGSDFDVDTVYAMVYNMFKDKDGNIKKIEFDNDTSYEGIRRRYINYVSRFAKLKLEKGFYEGENQIEDLNKLNDEIEKLKTQLFENKEVEKELRDNYRKILDNIYSLTGNKHIKSKLTEIIENAQNNRENKTDDGSIIGINYYNEILNELNSVIYDTFNDFTEEDKSTFIMVKNAVQEIVDYGDSINTKYDELHKDIANYKNIKEDALEETVKKLNDIAVSNGIVSFDEFSKWDIVKQNSKKARENVVLDNFIKIMSHPDSREENYYSSNFDDISDANAVVKEAKSRNKVADSVYNPFVQIQNLEDAMAGAALKAFSVSRDTFGSLCNVIKAELSESVKVRYHKENKYDADNNFDKQTIESAYDLVENESNDEVFVVKHNRLNWSKNNRNVAGKLCTPYNAQTTAHSLDTIKEGGIYNNNLYTFGTFKTLIQLGIDYNTAISWLALPGIERIVKHYYKTNSAYLSESANPIREAIKELGMEYLNVDEFTPYKEILNQLKNICSKEARELGYDITNPESILTLDTKIISDRLQGNTNPNLELAVDLITILQFEKLHDISSRLEELMRCTNPDKFGAKQSIHETYEVVDKVDKYRKNGSSIESNVKTAYTVLVNGVPLMDALYPRNEETNNIEVSKSCYPYIAAFYKYSTQMSVFINKNLFTADNILMLNEKGNFNNQLKFFGRKLTNDEYKQLREYLVHYIYSLDELLTSPVSIAVENIKGKRNSKGNIILKDNEKTYYWEEEYARIKGLETTLKDVYIKDYDNPTQEEVDAFAKLTPVKKLKLLRRHYGDNSSILSKFGLNLFAGRNTGDRIKSGNYTQTISINIENENIEELYREFNNIISSKNPLIKLTAIDLIKYAFMVEGFRFTRNGITNVITNNSISNNRDGFAINGINNEGDLTLIQSIYNIMNKIEKDVIDYNFTTITEVFDRFVRSHSEIIKDDRFLFRLSEGKNKKGFIPEKCTLDYNSYYFRDSDEYGEKVINYIKDKYNLNRSSTDPKNEHAILPRYIRLSHLCRKKVGDKVEYGEVTILFRICETPNGLLLIGVPKLDRNETYSGSINQDNNKNPFNNKAYINPMFIDAIFNEVFSADANDELVNEKGEQIKLNIKLEGVDTLTFKKQSFKADKSYDKEDILFRYLDSSESKKGGANHLIDAVNDFLANSPVEGISQEFMFLTLNPNMVNLLSKDDVKGRNNVIRIPNTNTYIKLTPKVITSTFMKAVRGNEEIAEKLGYGYKDAIRVGKEQLSRLENKNVRNKDAKMYKVEILSRESADAYRHGNIELRSATTLLGFEEGATARQVSTTSHRNFTGESQIALTLGSVIKDVLFSPASKNDVFLTKLRNFVQFNGIRVNEEQDITKYRKQLYDLLKDYYLIKGTEFLHKFDNYFANDDNISIDSEAIQQLLIDNPDGFNEFVKFLLDARNFGKEFDKFVKFINNENTNDNTFDEIVKIIKAVSENDKLSKAIKNVFNEYLATRFSTNPLVQNRLIDITMSFEDASKMDKIFADVAELSNKEVQLVVKYVEAILDSSSQLDVPAKQREFSETYDKLIKEGADLSRIIDSSTGKFLQDFTEDFIKDKEKYSDDYHKAKNAMNVAKNKYKNGDITVEEYEQTIIDYYRTRLNRNIWIRRNIHQAYADSYYDEVNNNELNVLFNSSSYKEDIAKTFAKYIRLTEELNEIVENKTTFTDEEIVNIKTIKAAIRELLNPSSLDDVDYLTGTLTEEQLKDKTVSDTLNEYLKNRSNINKKYFEYIVSEEWKATKNMYEQYIKDYDKLHPDFNIIDKLNDTRYKEAYNWLFVNSKRELNNKGQAKLNKAIEDIHADIERRKDIEAIFEKDKAFDEYGNKDPRKLSKKSIDKIKEITQQNNNLINVDTENRVIKELPKDRKVIITNRKFRDLLEPFDNTKNLKKQKIVKRINEILIKGVERNTGNISTKLLWENTTVDERKELAKLFKDLNEFKSGAKKEQVEKLKNRVNFKTNREAYERNKNEAILLNLSEEDMKIWEGIFSTFDKELGKREPNRFMFGYIEIKDKYDTEYLDKEKTDAINFLSRNTNRRPTVYYYLSRNEAIENDRYEEWFNENHYYNTYTNRIEPLTIWTETEVVPGAEVHGEDGFEYNTDYTDLTTEETIYEYNPTFDNKYRQIREEYINKPNGQEYNKYDYNYRTDTGDYNNTSSYKGLSNEQKEATEALRQLLIRYAKEYAFTNQAKAFVNKGFLPRQYVPVHNAAYFFKEAGKFIGIDGGKGQPKEYHNLDYSKDELPNQSMYDIIKNKGFRDEKPLPKQPKDANEEELKVYYEELDKVRKENAKIREDNLKLENAVRSNDWKGIFNQLISTGEDYKSRQKAKNVVYLLLEDLKSKNPNDSSKAFKRNNLTGKLIKTDRNINNPLSFEQVEQDNLYHVVSTWARRVIYSEYKEPHKLNNFARIAQNVVSSKYMTFNFPGGIANVSTGFTNIFGEMFAGTYFDTKNVKNGWWEYHTGAVDYIRGFMFNIPPKTKAGAILKLFNVVDYDRLLNRTGDETLSEISEKIRNSLFVFQSGGEHFMQNIALLSLLDSHRVYQHTRRDGKVEWKVGTFNNYIWDIEQQAMRIVLKEIEQEIGDEDSLTLSYENFVNFISKDIEALDEYDSFKKDFNREFIKTMYEGDKSEIAKRYREKVKELKKNAKEEFESKYNTFYNEFEFDENGGLRLKADSVFRDKSKPISDDPFDVGFADKYKDSIFGAFRNKVKKVNNKIHGVYDKLGAASLESTHWLGSLIMQYHKHIYPGLMKRYRGLFNRGYYNEMRESVEMGSYATLVNFLGIEFDGLIKRTKNDVELNNSLTMLAFLKETILSIFNTFKNLSLNWNTLKDWEIANMRRVLGDLLGCFLAFGSAMLIYAGTDDDELEDNVVYATMLYLTDRIYSEARMYTPWGLVGEAKTLWSSPIAVNNTILDILKLSELGIQWIFDDEFNPTYTTGLYKGENKFVVRLGRNVPIYRIINRVANMDKNNKYYRIGQKGIHKPAKTIADYINGD